VKAIAKTLTGARRWLEHLGALRVFRVVLAAIAATLLCLAFHRCALLFDMRRWETTVGTVKVSKVASETVTHGRSRGTMYVPVVRYVYRVEGKDYRSDRIAVGDLRNGHVTKVKPVVNRYPAGSTVTVFYDPEEPQEALLEAPGAALSVVATLAGLLLLGVAAWKNVAESLGRLLVQILG